MTQREAGSSNPIVNINQPRQSQALPALVNIFIPPVGQLIQGRVLAFVGWFLAFVIINVVVAFVTLGFGLLISIPLMWLLCIVDAAKYQPR